MSLEDTNNKENMSVYRPLYVLHTLSDSMAETLMQFHPPGSWMMREHPYAITIRIEDGYIHHTNILIRAHATPEVIDFSEKTHIYPTVSSYLDSLANIYGLEKSRQVILQNWNLKNAKAHRFAGREVSVLGLLGN